MKKFLSLLAFAALTGCVTVQGHSLSGSMYPSSQGKAVTASVSDMGFLHLTAPEVNVRDELAKQCPGMISNVESETTMRDILLVQLYNTTASGYCK